jgi:FkbM family methyltransferase
MIKEFVKTNFPEPMLNALYTIYKRVKYREMPRYESPFTDNSLDCLVAYNEFGGYCVPRSSMHRPALQATLRGEVWERETLNFLTSHCNNGDIIHAGTYFGDFLPALSAACAQTYKVWAFEPNPENFSCANMTITINRLENVELTNAGLGAGASTVSMVTKDLQGRGMGGGSTIVKGENSPAGIAEEVNIVAIDDTVPSDRPISILQLDVEGYEEEVLIGAEKTIRRCRPILVLEILPDMQFMEDNIFPLGYKVEGEVQGNTILKANV